MNKIAAVRGMPVIPPAESARRRRVEEKLIQVLTTHGYRELRFPFLERTDLFRRSVGDDTDIVAKEMYEFTDKSDESVCLRPEGTAGLLRAGLQLGMLQNQRQRLWYLGPMFRYERPQSGRSRQFDQLGAESIGFASAESDAEIIMMTARFWQALDLPNPPQLQLNTLGDAKTRQRYAAALKVFFTPFAHQLGEDDQRRLTTNPMRLLDSKHPATQALVTDAPPITDYVAAADKEHLRQVCSILAALAIPYAMNPYLVRGLDYYTKIVFEWVSPDLGAQNTVCAGGRYDDLIERLGGAPTKATGFALGMERLMLLLNKGDADDRSTAPRLMLVSLVGATQLFTLRQKMAEELPPLEIECALDAPNLKRVLKRADQQKIPFVVILGEEEEAAGLLMLRDMRLGAQEQLNWPAFCEKMKEELAAAKNG